MIDPYLLLFALPRGRAPSVAHAAYGLVTMIGLALAVMTGIEVTGVDQPSHRPPATTVVPVTTTTAQPDQPGCYMFCDG
ncbi:hypothetical protein [Nocardia sp. NPDC051833]|uniref:hypothetical protein n=1 Tax=Nocardia sp. NPDC051833 TaxID=3155674 RepID=UPI0034187C37